MPKDSNSPDQQIQDTLPAAEQKRQAILDRDNSDMAIYEDRQGRFNDKTSHIVRDIIRPAMQKLVAHLTTLNFLKPCGHVHDDGDTAPLETVVENSGLANAQRTPWKGLILEGNRRRRAKCEAAGRDQNIRSQNC